MNTVKYYDLLRFADECISSLIHQLEESDFFKSIKHFFERPDYFSVVQTKEFSRISALLGGSYIQKQALIQRGLIESLDVPTNILVFTSDRILPYKFHEFYPSIIDLNSNLRHPGKIYFPLNHSSFQDCLIGGFFGPIPFMYCDTSDIDAIVDRLLGSIYNDIQYGWIYFAQRVHMARLLQFKEDNRAKFQKEILHIFQEWNESLYKKFNGDYQELVTKARECRDQYQSSNFGVLAYVQFILEHSWYEFNFNHEISLEFTDDNLIIDFRIPSIDDIPNSTYRELKKGFISDKLKGKSLQKLHHETLCAIAIRSIFEVLHYDDLHRIHNVCFNGYLKQHNPGTGKLEEVCISSLCCDRNAIKNIDLRNVDVVACFKYLNGVILPKLNVHQSITPIMSIDRHDKRIISSKDIDVANIENLAQMPWEDFEHLVRQIFEWEFEASGAEVSVTQASRDGGVDAIIFDPDPIRGGKIVVQAKRYNNTVGVSAVRDLYGTIINEGANKGILITTSDYGADSYKFASGKPITLLNGGHLIYLLQKHGKNCTLNISSKTTS